MTNVLTRESSSRFIPLRTHTELKISCRNLKAFFNLRNTFAPADHTEHAPQANGLPLLNLEALAYSD